MRNVSVIYVTYNAGQKYGQIATSTAPVLTIEGSSKILKTGNLNELNRE